LTFPVSKVNTVPQVLNITVIHMMVVDAKLVSYPEDSILFLVFMMEFGLFHKIILVFKPLFVNDSCFYYEEFGLRYPNTPAPVELSVLTVNFVIVELYLTAQFLCL